MRNLLLLLFFSVCAKAEVFEKVPDEYCSPEYYDCSEFSTDVFKNYSSAQAPALNTEESLYVGSCHMVSANYDKDHEHHGYFYFRKAADKIDFFGQFSFFSEENPYLNLTLEEVRNLNGAPSDYHVAESLSEWRVDTNLDPPWQYFMRESDSKLLVVGFWGYNDSITCSLEKK